MRNLLMVFIAVLTIFLTNCCSESRIEENSNKEGEINYQQEVTPSFRITILPTSTVITNTVTSVVAEEATNSPTINPKLIPTFEWWNQERKENIEIGESIINAIEKFHKKQGYYPKTLNELQPEYIRLIPKTTTNYAFIYDLYSSENYIIKFPFTRRNIACGYSSTSRGWECSYLLSYP